MHRALDIGGRQAAVYTPIDTKTLINSQFRGVEVKGTLFTGVWVTQHPMPFSFTTRM